MSINMWMRAVHQLYEQRLWRLQETSNIDRIPPIFCFIKPQAHDDTMAQKAKVTTVARFPEHFFLENIVVRQDGSILVTVYIQKKIFYIPKPGSQLVTPQLLHEFDQFTTGIVEVKPDVFYISTTSVKGDAPSRLWKLDMNNYTESKTDFPQPVLVFTFPSEARALNGSCLISPSTILLADSWADLIWRVDFSDDGSVASAHTWLKHEMLGHLEAKTDVPGVNGLKYNPNDHHVYFTSTARTIFGRVPINTITCEPAGEPMDVTDRWMQADDLLIDETTNACYVTTHRQNTIEKFDLNSFERVNIIGNPVDLQVLGPTAGAWGRELGEYGRVAYFTTDGGHMNPYNGEVRPASVVRIEFS